MKESFALLTAPEITIPNVSLINIKKVFTRYATKSEKCLVLWLSVEKIANFSSIS